MKKCVKLVKQYDLKNKKVLVYCDKFKYQGQVINVFEVGNISFLEFDDLVKGVMLLNLSKVTEIYFHE